MPTLEEGSKGIHIENAQETWLPFSILFCKAEDAAISLISVSCKERNDMMKFILWKD